MQVRFRRVSRDRYAVVHQGTIVGAVYRAGKRWKSSESPGCTYDSRKNAALGVRGLCS